MFSRIRSLIGLRRGLRRTASALLLAAAAIIGPPITAILLEAGLRPSPIKRDARIRALRMDVHACGARLSWHTVGPTRSYVRYDKNFLHRTLPPAKARDWHEAELRKLKPGRRYQFRIIVMRPGSTKYSLTYTIRTRSPRVLEVPARYTLKRALETAGACDTIRVAPGKYPGGIKVPRGVRLVGAGHERTFLEGKGTRRVVTLNDESSIRGFTIRGSGKKYWDSGIWFTGSASPVIRANRIEKNSMGIAHYCWEACASGARIERNLIVNNAREGLRLEKAAAIVRGNTIYGNARGLYVGKPGIKIHDNIITGNRRFGIARAKATRSAAERNKLQNNIKNNILHENGPGGYHAPGQSPDEQVGAGNRIQDPLLRNPRRGDFRLSAGSPARKSGARRVDLGALPFRAAGRGPGKPDIERVPRASSHAYRLKNPGGLYYLYLAPGTKHFTRRIAFSGPELQLNGLPGGLETRAAWTRVRDGRESELSPVTLLRVPAHKPGVHPANGGTLRFQGDWKPARGAKSPDITQMKTSSPGARLFFEFRGESLVLRRSMSPAGGEADVILNGRYRGRISFRFREKRAGVPAVLDNLGPGPHRLELRARPGGELAIQSLQFPAPFRVTPDERHALQRVNMHRRLAGLGPLTPTWSLQLAARSHSRYFLRNRGDTRLKGLGFHREYPGLPGFIGESVGDRAAYFGFHGTTAEAGHFTGDPLWAVDGWVNTVYHRATVLDYAATKMGYGSAGRGDFRVDTLNSGHGLSRPRTYPGRRLIYTYPAHKQKDVPHDWDGKEVPDPLPHRDAQARELPVGFPISLYIIHPRNAKPAGRARARTRKSVRTPKKGDKLQSPWRVTKTELRDSRGRLTAVHVLDARTDPNKVLRPDTVFLIPRRALKTGERYSVFVAGTDSLGAPFRRRWYFRTRDADAVTSMHAEPAACQALLRWRSAGKVKSYVEYAGPGEPFKRFFPPGAAREAFFARIHDLKPRTVYRWRVVTISPGRNRVSMTRRFVTRPPRELRVPEQFASISAAFKAARACDVVRVAPGTYRGNLRLPRGVVLEGTDAKTTILQGDGTNSVVRIHSSGRVSGFTITGSGKDYWHAGVWIRDTPGVVVRGNRIQGNANGIVQYCFDSPCRASSRILGNTIRANTRRGIYIKGGTSFIQGNRLESGGGPALETGRGTNVIRKDNRITGGGSN